MNSCLHGYVSGRVQGVSFRAFVREQALRAGVSGWARNVPDGRVEVLLCGAESALQQIVHALHRGPTRARVTDVSLQPAHAPDVTGFTIG